jgi:hypothetical protein
MEVIALIDVFIGIRGGEDDDGDSPQDGVGLDFGEDVQAAFLGEVQVE